MNRIIALDVDSVLFPINEEHVLPALRKVYPNVTLPDITTFDYADCLGKEAKRMAIEVFKPPDLYDGFRLETEVEDAVRAALNL